MIRVQDQAQVAQTHARLPPLGVGGLPRGREKEAYIVGVSPTKRWVRLVVDREICSRLGRDFQRRGRLEAEGGQERRDEEQEADSNRCTEEGDCEEEDFEKGRAILTICPNSIENESNRLRIIVASFA